MREENQESLTTVQGDRLEDVRLLRSVSELRGTCYIELLPGHYRGTCWTSESVFLTEEAFGFIEPIVYRHMPAYDHYAFTEILKSVWGHIIVDVRGVTERLGVARTPRDLPELGYFFETTRTNFERDLGLNCVTLARTLRELTEWVVDTLERNDCVSVLGV